MLPPLSVVEGIGLSGQMHGAVLLDATGAVLRPAILWNDVRSAAECTDLETTFPTLRQVTGNIAMPGFTAPKLLWVRKHEPAVFASVRKVLLPKAYIRYRLTGEMIEEMSDASGTLWLDVGARDWSDVALSACGLTRDAMPRLVEGNAPAGALRPELAARWHMTRQPALAGGAGDNAAGAIGLSAIRPGDAFVSLGTSGVLFATTDGFRPYTQAAVHAFCHALPSTWHQMGVTLSAAASLAWWAGIIGRSRGGASGGDRHARDPPAQRYSCPISAVNGHPITIARSAAPLPDCRTTPTGGFLLRRCWRAWPSRCVTASMHSRLRVLASRQRTSSAAARAPASGSA